MKTICALALILLLGGCVSFQTNYNQATVPPFRRVLVVTQLPTIPRDLTSFQRAFPEQYEVCVADAGSLALTPPDSIINNQVRICQSEVLLTMKLNRSYIAGWADDLRSVNEYLLEMKEIRTGQTFWKAIVTNRPGPSQIVNRLRIDGIIEGKARVVYSEATTRN
jgi:hypothetical protein